MEKETFNWIPLSHRKNISIPKVTVEKYSNQLYSGYYTSNFIYALSLEEDNTEKLLMASLAHEFRHHIQHNLWSKLDHAKLNYTLNYEDMIKDYFSNSLMEMDALVFEYKLFKTDLNEWWLKKLVIGS